MLRFVSRDYEVESVVMEARHAGQARKLAPLQAHVWIRAIGCGAVAYMLSSHLSIRELCRMIALCKETRRAFSSQAIWREQATRVPVQLKGVKSIYEEVRDFRVSKFQQVASLIVPSYVTFNPFDYDRFLPHLDLFIRAGMDEHIAALLAYTKTFYMELNGAYIEKPIYYHTPKYSQFKCLLAASLHRRFDLFHHFRPGVLGPRERSVLLQVLDPEFDSNSFYEEEIERSPELERFYPLPYGPQPSDEDIAFILSEDPIEPTLANAKILSHFGPIFRPLLYALFKELGERARVEMVKHALSRDPELAKVLALQRPFSIGAREELLEAACWIGEEGFLRECLELNWEMSYLNRGFCVAACAAGSGNPQLMRFLLSRGEISYGVRSLAILRAASNGYLAVIKELRPSLLQPKQRAQALLATLRNPTIAKSIRADIALLLLNTGSVAESDSFNIILGACRIGSFEVLSYFDLQALTMEQRGKMVIQAAHGHFEMMVAIRNRGAISVADFEEATRIAAFQRVLEPSWFPHDETDPQGWGRTLLAYAKEGVEPSNPQAIPPAYLFPITRELILSPKFGEKSALATLAQLPLERLSMEERSTLLELFLDTPRVQSMPQLLIKLIELTPLTQQLFNSVRISFHYSREVEVFLEERDILPPGTRVSWYGGRLWHLNTSKEHKQDRLYLLERIHPSFFSPKERAYCLRFHAHHFEEYEMLLKSGPLLDEDKAALVSYIKEQRRPELARLLSSLETPAGCCTIQ